MKLKTFNMQLEKMGTMILLSNTRLDGKKVLRLYRRKDVVEKFFGNMKHAIDKKIKLIRLGVTKTIVTEVSKKQQELFQSLIIPLLYSGCSL